MNTGVSLFDEIQLEEISKVNTVKLENTNKRDIAIIGMSGKFAGLNDINHFWECVKNGNDCIRGIPAIRKKDFDNVGKVLAGSGMIIKASQDGYIQCGYMDRIDEFDCDFFSITPREAGLMDPNQRLFLENAWSTIENAGYGGKRIKGTKTGVYVGFSSDFSEEYKRYALTTDPELASLMTTGNIKSIIAGRIAYILDLKGPSMMIDTACSSALTAVHLACNAIRNGECEMAVAGGVKVHIYLSKVEGSELGIESSDGRTRTFDQKSDGTGLGEGVASVLLKPLHKALEDGDHIFAVIKGSAVNQDGSSIGITAPNAAAQEEVIVSAWKDAGIDCKTISYIEAHGTGTNLGDPIEINGLERAFRKFTTRKQFCAVGSVKTNIGHLDNLAGLAGLFKAVMALKHRQIPPTINFERPNRKIDFTDSPVYINDTLRDWETDGFPRRCGISSFGLSGTNCHVVVEEFHGRMKNEESKVKQQHEVLTISACSSEALMDQVENYRKYLLKESNDSLKDICYTANTGRGHYSHRLALITSDRDDLKEKLDMLSADGLKSINENHIFYSMHKLIPDKKKGRTDGDITQQEIAVKSHEANTKLGEFIGNKEQSSLLVQICCLYIEGADVNWDLIYKNENVNKVAIPAYPFTKRRCWIEPQNKEYNVRSVLIEGYGHPLIDKHVVSTIESDVYSTAFSTEKHWVLREHTVGGKHVIPGTTYLEIVREISTRYFDNINFIIRDVIFLFPFALDSGETNEVQTIVKRMDNMLEITIASKDKIDNNWVRHAECKVERMQEKYIDNVKISDIKAKCKIEKSISDMTAREGLVKTGPRWDNFRQVHIGENEFLVELEILPEYRSELEDYYLHPSLMDCAVNAAIDHIGEDGYLPFSYESLRMIGKMPPKFYSYIRIKEKQPKSMETVSFDVSLIDENNKVFAVMNNYTVKKVRSFDFNLNRKFVDKLLKSELFYRISWLEEKLEMRDGADEKAGIVLVFEDEKGLSQKIPELIGFDDNQVVKVKMGSEYQRLKHNRFYISGSERDYEMLVSELKDRNITKILHLMAITKNKEINEISELKNSQKRGMFSLYYLTRAIVKNRIRSDVEIIMVSDYAAEVDGSEELIKPHNATLFGLGKVVMQEYSNIKCRAVDIDDKASPEAIASEINGVFKNYQVAYRKNKRYTSVFDELDIRETKKVTKQIKQDGVYVITGGLGGIGLEIAKNLASKGKINLALLNRSSITSREEWDEIVKSGEDEKEIRKVMYLKDIEKNGSIVECYAVDVADTDHLYKVLNELREKFGNINGIIHCAGAAGDGFLINRDIEEFNNVAASKIFGTWNLHNLTLNDNLDFFIMSSSVVTISGEPGQGDYTAANAYLDSFTGYRRKNHKPALTINWPAWNETGMALEYGVLNKKTVFSSLSTAEAIRIFEELSDREISGVIPGELDYKSAGSIDSSFVKISDKLSEISNRYNESQAAENKNFRGKTNLKIKVTGDENRQIGDIEMQVARVWAKTLQMDNVNIYDTFIDMGGDSIMATHLLKEMNKEFDNVLDITDIFTYSTVNEMAEFLTGKLKLDGYMQEEDIGKEIRDEENIERVLTALSNGEINIDDVDGLIGL